MSVIQGDALSVLPTLTPGVISACVTSPPYLGLRDYGVPPTAWPAVTYAPMPGLPPVTVPAMTCALGAEDTPEAFVGHLLLIFREVHRLLPDTGTLLVNMGDSWATAPKTPQSGPHGSRVKQGVKLSALRGQSRPGKGGALPRKNLIGVPWRLAFALQADGWTLRQEIIWAKLSPMPESVRDRCTKAHEHLFLLSKRPSGYYWDAASIAEAVTTGDRGSTFRSGKTGLAQLGDAAPAAWRQPNRLQQPPARPQRTRALTLFREAGFTDAHLNAVRAVGLGTGDRARRLTSGAGRNTPATQALADEVHAALGGYARELLTPETRNARSVWTFPSTPFTDAHFAVMAFGVAQRAVLATTPPGGTVLDPFFGSGTTGRAALKHGRHFIGIELRPENVSLASRHLSRAQPGLPLLGTSQETP